MRVVFLFTSLLLTSCASLTPAGEALKIANSEKEVEHCVLVGKVAASSGFSNDGGMLLIGHRNSKIAIRNQAAEFGDTLLITKDDNGFFGSDRVGKVYICNPKDPGPSEELR